MLWGLSGDAPFDGVHRELVRRDVPLVVLDQRRLRGVRTECHGPPGTAMTLVLSDETVALDEIGAVFIRPFDIRLVVRELSAHWRNADAREAAAALHHELFAWTEIADALVVNRPSSMVSNGSKPFQTELIRRSGFDTPPTLVTTSPDVAREFVARYGQVVYKSVSDVRSKVTRVDEAECGRLDEVVHCPTQFQTFIAGTDWRVHVVGDDLFACEIACEADDYRCAALDGFSLEIRSATLPIAVAAECHALARALHLPLAGIDLRRAADGRWFCFEVNPAPAFTYYEQMTDQPLTAAVAGLLAAGVADAGRAAIR